MDHLFLEPMPSLPKADIPLDGVRAYLSQSGQHQLVFVPFENDVDLPEHSHVTPAAPQQAKTSPAVIGTMETILLIDDEDVIVVVGEKSCKRGDDARSQGWRKIRSYF